MLTECVEIYREVNHPREAMFFQALRGIVESSEGDYVASREHLLEAAEYARAVGDKQVLATALSGLGTLANHEGDYATARSLKEESLVAYRQIGDTWIISLINWSLSHVVIAQRDFESARAILSESASIAEQLGNEWLLVYVLEGFGRIAVEEGYGARGAHLFGTAEALRDRVGIPVPPTEREVYKKILERMLAQTTLEAFNGAWFAGRASAPDEAIRFALSPVSSDAAKRSPDAD